MNQFKSICLLVVFCLVFSGCSSSTDVKPVSQLPKKPKTENVEVTAKKSSENANVSTVLTKTGGLLDPVRLEADGKPIDIGALSNIAHAGPTIADVDCDGDKDLLVGDFPGFFWFFENENNDGNPQYTSRGKLQAGGEDAKTPVY